MSPVFSSAASYSGLSATPRISVSPQMRAHSYLRIREHEVRRPRDGGLSMCLSSGGLLDVSGFCSLMHRDNRLKLILIFIDSLIFQFIIV
jgi:hypothetical protein